jgi:hypothetical protein
MYVEFVMVQGGVGLNLGFGVAAPLEALRFPICWVKSVAATSSLCGCTGEDVRLPIGTLGEINK